MFWQFGVCDNQSQKGLYAIAARLEPSNCRVASRILKERWSHENSRTRTIRSTVLVASCRLSVGSVDVHDESNNGK